MAYPQVPYQYGYPYQFYGGAFPAVITVVTIDTIMNNVVPLMARAEAAIMATLAEFAGIDPGQLDQSRLMAAQMNMSRWQLASQVLSNMGSGAASGLKNTIQNIGR